MTTPATDGKMLVNALYYTALVSGLAAGYVRLGKIAIGGSPPKLDFTPRDVGMVVVDVALVMATIDMLIKQGLIPANISNARWWRYDECPGVLGVKLPVLYVEKL